MTLRYHLTPILLALGLSLVTTAGAETRVGGDITGNVQWTKAGSPYIVTADIAIQPGARLTIGPGVLVRFKPNLADQKGLRPFDLEIAVYGTLEATGADGDSIYFTSDAIDPSTQDWAGLVIPNAGGVIRLDRVVLETATSAVTVQEGLAEITRSQIRSCSERGVHFLRGRGRVTKTLITIIGNFAGTGKGIALVQSPDVVLEENFIIGAQTAITCERGSDARIHRNLLSLCRLTGLVVTSSSPDVVGNNITQNEFGVILRGNSNPRIKDNNIFDNATWDMQVKDYRNDNSDASSELDMSGNWWGRITADVIPDRIEDGTDNPAAGATVRIDPVRREPYQAN